MFLRGWDLNEVRGGGVSTAKRTTGLGPTRPETSTPLTTRPRCRVATEPHDRARADSDGDVDPADDEAVLAVRQRPFRHKRRRARELTAPVQFAAEGNRPVGFEGDRGLPLAPDLGRCRDDLDPGR